MALKLIRLSKERRGSSTLTGSTAQLKHSLPIERSFDVNSSRKLNDIE